MMELDKKGAFSINVYSPGNLIAQEITINGNVSLGGDMQHGGFSDEQVARALESIVGKGKPIDAKWKWAGAYWYLRWACSYPVNAKDFCEHIAQLPFSRPLEYACDYRNIRELTTLTFMGQDPRQMEKVKASSGDQQAFVFCRTIALKLAEELGKTCLPPT